MVGTCSRNQVGYVLIVHTVCDRNRGCRTSNTATQNNLVVVVVVVVVVMQEHDVNAEQLGLIKVAAFLDNCQLGP